MLNLAEHAYGLDREDARRVNEMVQEHYPNLSLRRIPENDPFFTPEKPWGIYEETAVAGQPKWVFALSDYSLDHRVLARLFENDMSRPEVAGRTMESLFAAEEASRQKWRQEQQEQRNDEMLQFLLAAQGKNYMTMTVDGDRMKFGDGPAERTRAFIV